MKNQREWRKLLLSIFIPVNVEMRAAKYHFDSFLYAYLTMASGCIYFLFGFIEGTGAENNQKAGDTLGYQAIWLALYVVLILKLIKWTRFTGPLLLRSGLLLAFVLIVTWSLIDNGADKGTLIKFGMYLMTIAFAAWLSVNKSVDSVFHSLFWIGITVLVLHLAAYPWASNIDWDTLGRSTLLGTTPYGGLFGHKNLAGNFFAVGALVCFAKFLSPSCTNKLIYIFLMVIHTFMVVLSGAIGALIALMLSVVLAFGIYLVVERINFFASIYWMMVAVFVLVVEAVGTSYFFELVGRDANLTGRDNIWAAGMLFFWERPLLGYGYSNFFAPIERALQFWWLMPFHAHIQSLDNSYLDILIQFGVIGGIFLAAMLLKAIWTALRFAIRDSSAYRIGPIALLTFVLISSISDSILLLHNYLFCVLVFWVYFGLKGTKRPELAAVGSSHQTLQWPQAFVSPNLGGQPS